MESKKICLEAEISGVHLTVADVWNGVQDHKSIRKRNSGVSVGINKEFNAMPFNSGMMPYKWLEKRIERGIVVI